MTVGTPDTFQFSIKVSETVTRDKRLDINKEAITHLEEFLDKISPLKVSNKLELYLSSFRQALPSKNIKIKKNFLTKVLVDMIMLSNSDSVVKQKGGDVPKAYFQRMIS